MGDDAVGLMDALGIDRVHRGAEGQGGIVGINVEKGPPRSMLLVPESAIQLDQAGRYVLVVDDSRKVELRRVTTGAEQGSDIVITEGLKAGEQIIVEGIQKVRPGQIVAASPAPGN